MGSQAVPRRGREPQGGHPLHQGAAEVTAEGSTGEGREAGQEEEPDEALPGHPPDDVRQRVAPHRVHDAVQLLGELRPHRGAHRGAGDAGLRASEQARKHASPGPSDSTAVRIEA